MSNLLQEAVAAVAPELAAAFVSYVEANKPAIESRITTAGDSAITYVENAIIAAVPTNNVLAKVFSPEFKAVVNALAQKAIAKAGGEVDALIALAEMEVTNLAAQLSAPVKP